MSAAAAAMIVGSSVAQAAPVADARAGSPVAEAEGMSSEILLGLFAAILLVIALIGINDNDVDDNFPTSP
jgi:purine-cytosine permease-like protein